MANSPNIKLQLPYHAGLPLDYGDRVTAENDHSGNLDRVDRVVGSIWNGTNVRFSASGSAADKLAAADHLGSAMAVVDMVVDSFKGWFENILAPTSGGIEFALSVTSASLANATLVSNCFVTASSKLWPSTATSSLVAVIPAGSVVSVRLTRIIGLTGSAIPEGLAAQLNWHPSGSW